MLDPTVPTQVSGSPADHSLIPDYFWPRPDDRLSPGQLIDWADWAGGHPVITGIAGLLALGALVIVFFTVRALARAMVALARHTITGAARLARATAAGRTAEDILTITAASIATIVAGQGMWQFLDRIIGDVPWPLRALMFAFLEIAVVTSAVRARRSMREKYSAGIDGIAVWALTSISAVLSALEARSLPETVFRLASPLVAAWLWERGMAIERRKITGRSRIHWRITPERVLVRLGLAETTDRTASEVDAQRRLTRVALAAKRARALRATSTWEWRQRRALARLERAYTAAAEHAGLARNSALQEALAGEVAALYSAPALLDVAPASAWTRAQVSTSDAQVLAARERPDRESLAAVASMAAHVAEQRVAPRPAPAAPAVQPQVLFPAPAPAGKTRPESATAAPPAPESATATAPTDDAESAPAPGSEAPAPGSEAPAPGSEAPAPESAIDRMYETWKRAVAEGRRPTGIEIGAAGGRCEQNGRKYRAIWERTLTPEQRARLRKKPAA